MTQLDRIDTPKRIMMKTKRLNIAQWSDLMRLIVSIPVIRTGIGIEGQITRRTAPEDRVYRPVSSDRKWRTRRRRPLLHSIRKIRIPITTNSLGAGMSVPRIRINNIKDRTIERNRRPASQAVLRHTRKLVTTKNSLTLALTDPLTIIVDSKQTNPEKRIWPQT